MTRSEQLATARKAKADKAEAERTVVEKWLAGTSWNNARRPATALERQHRHREAARSIDRDFYDATLAIDWKRRKSALKSPRSFIREYCMGEGGIFDYEPFAEADAILDCMVKAATSGVPYHLRVARGIGKTTLMIWLAAFLLCRHEKTFIVLTGSKLDMATPMVEDLANLFILSDALAQDFPEFSLPMKLLGGSMQRASSQRFRGKPTLVRFNSKVIRFPVLGGCPLLDGFEGGAIVIANGFDGKARGFRVGKRRPDFILLDDLQDDEMAGSPEQVEKAKNKIYRTYLKLGKNVKKPSVLMTSTANMPGDLSETFASDPNWHTETFPLMLSMPSDSAMDLWRQYKKLNDADIANLTTAEQHARMFYREHRAEMDDGAKPLFKENYDHETEDSSVENAMKKFLEDEASFMSECQMQPKAAEAALDVPRQLVAKRVLPGSRKGVVPEGFTFVAAATDINPSYALTTSIVAFKPDRTAFLVNDIVSPIRIDGKLNDSVFTDALYAALAAHGRMLRSLGLPIRAWGIDGSGRQYETVTAFARVAARVPDIALPACALLGRSSTKFNPFVKSRLRDAINDTVYCGDPVAHIEAGRHVDHAQGSGKYYVYWNSDKYRESAQRAVLSEIGAPGGFTLFENSSDGHVDFAMQFTNEKLMGKRTRPDGIDEYFWKSAEPHDKLDTVAMCFAIAAMHGFTGSARSAVRPIIRKKRKVVIV